MGIVYPGLKMIMITIIVTAINYYLNHHNNINIILYTDNETNHRPESITQSLS